MTPRPIAKAVVRENMRFVPTKSAGSSICRHCRKAVINQVRAFLLERGIGFRKGPASLRKQMPETLENADAQLSPRIRALLAMLWRQRRHVEEQISALSTNIETFAARDPACQRLREITRIGPLIVAAVVAVGDDAAFSKGREFAAWLGLIAKQYSTGSKARLLGISKGGNPYLRKMFIHGARAAVLRLKREGSAIGAWMNKLEARAPCATC